MHGRAAEFGGASRSHQGVIACLWVLLLAVHLQMPLVEDKLPIAEVWKKRLTLNDIVFNAYIAVEAA